MEPLIVLGIVVGVIFIAIGGNRLNDSYDGADVAAGAIAALIGIVIMGGSIYAGIALGAFA